MSLDQIMAYISAVLSFLGQVPGVGKYLAIALALITAISLSLTALVGAWHAIVMAIQAVSMIPGLGSLKALSDSLKASDDAISDFVNNKILVILNRLSTIPLPKLPSP